MMAVQAGRVAKTSRARAHESSDMVPKSHILSAMVNTLVESCGKCWQQAVVNSSWHGLGQRWSEAVQGSRWQLSSAASTDRFPRSAYKSGVIVMAERFGPLPRNTLCLNWRTGLARSPGETASPGQSSTACIQQSTCLPRSSCRRLAQTGVFIRTGHR